MKTNYRFGEVYKLADEIQASDEKVQFKEIFENENGGVCLLAFKEGQYLDTHLAPAEVMVCVAEGEIEFTMNGNKKTLRAGEFLLMGNDVPHSVSALKDSKVMLVKVKSTK